MLKNNKSNDKFIKFVHTIATPKPLVALLLLDLLASKLVLTLDISMHELGPIHKSQGQKAVSQCVNGSVNSPKNRKLVTEIS